MKEEQYYYPLWDDSLKLNAEEMIEYLLNEIDKNEIENNIKTVPYGNKHYIEKKKLLVMKNYSRVSFHII